ncbi:hypothetical protein D3C72_1777590 [compost metagenome]
MEGSSLHGLRAGKRLAGYQRYRAQQCERRRAESGAGLSGQGRGAGGHLPALWHPRVPERALQRAHRAGRADHRRSARPAGATMVARQGRGDLRPYSRFRWLPGEGQFGRTARPAGLRPFACGRCQPAGRCAGTARWRGDVAGFCLRARRTCRPRHPGVCRVCRPGRRVPPERDRASEERAHRLPAA